MGKQSTLFPFRYTTRILGRGDSALGSVTVAKEISDEVQSFYDENFGYPFNPHGDHGPVNDLTFELFQNYPNPFNSTSRIRYTTPEDGIVTIGVFNILGQKVKILLNKFQKANQYEVNFNGSSLASGVYIYRITAGNYPSVKKLILLK